MIQMKKNEIFSDKFELLNHINLKPYICCSSTLTSYTCQQIQVIHKHIYCSLMKAKISHRKLEIDIGKAKSHTKIKTSFKAFDYMQIQEDKIRPNLGIMKISYLQ